MRFGKTWLKGSKETEKLKILFQFSIMLIASVIGGICFTALLSDTATQRLSQKALLSISEDIGTTLLIGKIWSISAIELICIAVLFVFSFSLVNYTVSDIALVFLGFKWGMSAAVVKLTGFESFGMGNSLSFWILRGAILFVIFFFACKMAFFSLDIRTSSLNGRGQINSKKLVSLILFALSVAIAIWLLNGIYCFVIYIL